MLRPILFALVLGFSGAAAAEEFPHSVQGLEVHGDDGTVVGHVDSAVRDARAQVVAVEVAGLEPEDAPLAMLVSENSPRMMRSQNIRRDLFSASSSQVASNETATRTRSR